METTAEPQAEPAQAARWEDFVDIFISPGAVYRRRADDSWALPWLVVSAIGIVLYYVFLPANQIMMEAAFRESSAGGNPQAMQAAQKVGGIMQMVGGVFVPVGLLIVILAAGFLLWAGIKATGGDITFKRALLIPAWSSAIGILQSVVVSVLIIMQNTNSDEPFSMVRDTSVGVMRFLPADTVPATLVPMLARLDVFALWQMVLWAIGLQVLARCSKGQAWGVATVAWLLFGVPGVIKALFAKPAA